MSEAWSVVVTRESEWDETTRGRAIALIQAEADLCKCGCGLPMSIAHDPTQAFLVDTWVCYAGRAKTRKERDWKKANSDDKGNLRDPSIEDGLHHFVTPATREDEHRIREQQKAKRQDRTNRRRGASRGH